MFIYAHSFPKSELAPSGARSIWVFYRSDFYPGAPLWPVRANRMLLRMNGKK